MLEDVLAALAGARRLGGILVNTVDPRAAALAERYGARVVTDGARDGHTGAVMGMARVLAAERPWRMLTLPGDIPRVTAGGDRYGGCVAAARQPSFTIVPAHDELGSNAVLCAPPVAVPLRFGDDSYFPHLDGRAPARHRADHRAAARHRAGHRPSRRSAHVPARAPHADADAGIARNVPSLAPQYRPRLSTARPRPPARIRGRNVGRAIAFQNSARSRER